MPLVTNQPAQLDLLISQGAACNIVFTLYQDEAHTQLLSLVGYTASMKVRPSKTSSETLVDLSNRLTVNGAAGTVTLAMTGAQTAVLGWAGKARYDLVLTAAGDVLIPFAGTFAIDSSPTV